MKTNGLVLCSVAVLICLRGWAGPSIVRCDGFGGSGLDEPARVAASSNSIVILGSSTSTNFPLSGPVNVEPTSDDNVFLMKLDSSGTNVAFSTFLGFVDGVGDADVAMDSHGNSFVVGRNAGFHMTNEILPALVEDDADLNRAVVVKIAPDGDTLTWRSLGESRYAPYRITLDGRENVYVFSLLPKDDMPGALAMGDHEKAGDDAGFALSSWTLVTKLDDDLTNVCYQAAIGASEISALAVDTNENVYVVGTAFTPLTCSDTNVLRCLMSTNSAMSKTKGDRFVAKIASNGQSLVFLTYLDANSQTTFKQIATDSQGAIWLLGQTYTFEFPLAGAGANPRGPSILLMKISADGRTLLGGRYIDGRVDSGCATMALSEGCVYLAGTTNSVGKASGFLHKISASDCSLLSTTILGGEGDTGICGISVSDGMLNLIGQSSIERSGTNIYYTPLPVPGNDCSRQGVLIMKMAP
jgi:hypothetical protein